MKITAFAIAMVLFVVPTASSARSHGGSHSSGHVRGFATSHCKSTSCFRKHPDAKYVHPLTTRKHR